MSQEAFGTLLQREKSTAATLQTGVEGNDNAILWTAVSEGLAGNSVTVTLVDPAIAGELTVTVTGTDVVVTLEYVGAAVVSTASEVIAAVQAHDVAFSLVIPSHYLTSDGTGVVVAEAEANLAGGLADAAYATVAEVKDISGPNMSRATMEVTNHDSATGWKEFIIGPIDSGEAGFQVNFLPDAASHNYLLGLVKDFQHGVERSWRLEFPDTTAYLFTGSLSAFSLSEPVSGLLSGNLSIKITGSFEEEP